MPNIRGKAKRDLTRAANDVLKMQTQIAWQLDTFADLPKYQDPLKICFAVAEHLKTNLVALADNFDTLTTP
jgi:hypothetical protein